MNLQVRALQRTTATHCNTLQHTAAHCSTLQHTATHCSTLQHTRTAVRVDVCETLLQCSRLTSSTNPQKSARYAMYSIESHLFTRSHLLYQIISTISNHIYLYQIKSTYITSHVRYSNHIYSYQITPTPINTYLRTSNHIYYIQSRRADSCESGHGWSRTDLQWFPFFQGLITASSQ